MGNRDKTYIIEELNKKLLGEGYTFGDANEETANQVAGIIMKNYKGELTKIVQSLEGDESIKELDGLDSATIGLAVGLVIQKIIMS